MKKIFLGLGLLAALAGVGTAQTANSKTEASATSKTTINKNGSNLNLQSGTQIAAQLQNSLNVKRARVGDQVVLKTSKAIKQNGRIVVDKGARLFGRVTEIQQKSGGNAVSKIGIAFDKLEQGGRELPINAVITSVTQTNAQSSVGDMAESDISANSSAQATTRNSNSGGLLGGVGNAVGGVVNTTAKTVGGATKAVGRTVGKTTNAVGGTLNGIQVSQSSETSAEGSSVLSLQGGDLNLEKGATFSLRLSSSTSINDQN